MDLFDCELQNDDCELGSRLDEGQVVAMDHFFVGALAQNLFDTIGSAPANLSNLCCAVVDEPSSDFDRLRIDYRDDIAFSELAIYLANTDRQ